MIDHIAKFPIKIYFLVDGSGAGSGDLEILVEGGRVTSSVRSLGGQRFKAAFTPHQALPHRVDIKFNGETVPGKCLGFLSAVLLP